MQKKSKTTRNVLLVAAIFFLLFSPKQTAFAQTFAEGIVVDGESVAGLSEEEEEERIRERLELAGESILTLRGRETGKELQVRATDLGLFWENPEVLSQAVTLGHKTNAIARFKDEKEIERTGGNYPVRFSLDAEKIKEFLSQNAEAVNREPVEASLVRQNGAFTVVPGESGFALNVDASAEELSSFIEKAWTRKDATFDLVIEEADPKIKAEDIARVGEILGTFTTSYGASGMERSMNIANGCKLVDGTLLYPGEEFSMLSHLTPFTEENGYYLAGSYLGNKVVDSLGGGICQVSTTLYNAVIRAELKVTQRSNHSMMVSYVKESMDAAIAESAGMDFKFVNSSDYPIYIEGFTADKNITFTIYGVETRERGRFVAFESEVLETIEPEGNEVVTDATQPVGYVSVSAGHTGYRAQLWKIVTKDGKEISREIFNQSNYTTSPRTITVGTAGVVTEELQTAMASGNEESIRAAAKAAAGAQTVSVDSLTEAAGVAAQAAFSDAMAEGMDTESALQKAQEAANAVVESVTEAKTETPAEPEKNASAQETTSQETSAQSAAEENKAAEEATSQEASTQSAPEEAAKEETSSREEPSSQEGSQPAQEEGASSND